MIRTHDFGPFELQRLQSPTYVSSPSKVWSILSSKSTKFHFASFLDMGILGILHAICKKMADGEAIWQKMTSLKQSKNLSPNGTYDPKHFSIEYHAISYGVMD